MSVHKSWPVANEIDDDDKEFAKQYCLERGFMYLSHETYVTQTSHQVWIAVEDGTGRYEIKTSR